MMVIRVPLLDQEMYNLFNKQLELIILPTEKCNLNCVYCYEDFNINMMSHKHVEAIKKLINTRLYDLNVLTIQWFGGEPLLGYPIITEIMAHIQKLRGKNDTPILNGLITTNAYLLTLNKLSKLVSLGVTDYQITLDGDKEEHDKLRIRRGDNGGTFDVIWKNILVAHQSNIPFLATLRLHVNNFNKISVESLLRRASEELCNDKRFQFHIRPLSRLGGKNDNVLPITDDLNLISELKQFSTSLGLINQNADAYSGISEAMCYAAKPSSYIIRADGHIGKCTIALYNDINAVGKLNEDGTLELDNSKITRWSRGLFTGNIPDLECPLVEIKKEQQLLRTTKIKKISLQILK